MRETDTTNFSICTVAQDKRGEPASNATLLLDKIRNRNYTPIQLYFLQRFRFMQNQKTEFGLNLNAGDFKMRALNKALYSTYLDCKQADLIDEVEILISKNEQPRN